MNLSIKKPKQFRNEIKKKTKQVNKKPPLCRPVPPSAPLQKKKDNNKKRKHRSNSSVHTSLIKQ